MDYNFWHAQGWEYLGGGEWKANPHPNVTGFIRSFPGFVGWVEVSEDVAEGRIKVGWV